MIMAIDAAIIVDGGDREPDEVRSVPPVGSRRQPISSKGLPSNFHPNIAACSTAEDELRHDGRRDVPQLPETEFHRPRDAQE